MGDDLVLLTRENSVCWEEIIKGSEDWLKGIFVSVVPWSPSISLKRRFAWIRCYGIPLHLWKKQSFSQLLTPIGEVFDLDASTEDRSRLEYARMRIRTSKLENVASAWDMTLNGTVHGLRIVEEMPHSCIPLMRVQISYGG